MYTYTQESNVGKIESHFQEKGDNGSFLSAMGLEACNVLGISV